jgi:hypothetical protein
MSTNELQQRITRVTRGWNKMRPKKRPRGNLCGVWSPPYWEIRMRAMARCIRLWGTSRVKSALLVVWKAGLRR